ncbi:MAG: hypothetical protein HC905_15185 [Bacteroidales bacterium]|nr:hypothetical protein [Bacteroidales bacterium]
MNSDHFCRFSRFYAILKKITSFYHSLYYEEIHIENAGNVPVDDPVIFTPNHQNALMDALAIIYTLDKQPVFMARADIFKKDTLKKILTSLKIIPVYRIRDGIESLSNNDSSFEYAFQVLKHRGAVGIMPEGNHGEQRRLRPLKKGVARLAIQSQELLEKEQSIKIIPVGLDFTHYQNFRSNMLVIYGEPVNVRDYLEEYRANPAKGLQSIRNRIGDELKKVMIHIDSDEYYDTIYDAKELYSHHHRVQWTNHYGKFLLEKKLTDILTDTAKTNPVQLITMKEKMDQLNLLSSQLGLKPWVFSWKSPRNMESWLSDFGRYMVFAPVFICAALFHAIPFAVSEYYSNKVKDKQFVSSMRFVLSFLAYLIWYLIFLAFPVSIIIKVILVITMPVLGVMSYDYWDSLKKIRVKANFLLLKRKGDSKFLLADKLYKDIIQWLNLTTGRHEN